MSYISTLGTEILETAVVIKDEWELQATKDEIAAIIEEHLLNLIEDPLRLCYLNPGLTKRIDKLEQNHSTNQET